MTEACRAWRRLLGAHVIGQLPAEDEPGLMAHLDGCADCRREAEDLTGVVRALEVHRLDGRADPPVAPAVLAERVVDAVRAEAAQRRGHRRRFRVAVASAAALGTLLGAVGATAMSRDRAPDAAGQRITLAGAAPGVRAEATVSDRRWGSGIWLTASGLRGGELYATWLERPDGSRVSAGTFRPDRGGTIRCYLTAGISQGDAAAVGVSDARGRTVLLAHLR